MNIADFTYLLQNPQNINTEQIDNLKSILNDYPFFQSARALHLKGLKNKESFKYNQELKVTAAHTTDRSVLFDFITSENFNQNEISSFIKQNSENLKGIELKDVQDISVNKSVVIDDALKQHIKESEPILDPHLFKEKEENTISIESEEVIETPSEKLKIGQPLEFDKTERHSFSEWLKITSFKPIIREEKEETPQPKQNEKTKKFELIDKFIATNPKISPAKKEGAIHNIANEQTMQPDTLMTETLARIYLEQKNYDKAIQAYKILSLKYPEKSGFFADQIQAVKDLQQNK